MAQGPIPWENVTVRYCPRCKLVHALDEERCSRCGGKLVDQVRREKLDEK